jgi:putative aldouronate transport system permease protein
VFIPLSKATLAVLVLYYAVAHWNAWFNASIYLTDTDKYPVQLVMRNLLTLKESQIDDAEVAQFIELIRYALIVVTTAPILFVYPFLQKYFTKGVMIGALKG